MITNDKTDEQWKDIEGYEGLYQVSNLGRIKCIRVITGRDRITKCKNLILKPEITRTGYLRISLQYGIKSRKLIHRLVAESFIPNPNNLPEVNHRIGDKADNRASNLEWVTKSSNIKHAFAIGLKSNAGIKNPFFGKIHSESSKLKISETKKAGYANR